MIFNTTELSNIIEDLLQETQRQKESIILDQLNDLITKNLLVVKFGPPMLTKNVDNAKLQLSQTVVLELKDKEYIEKLEKENKELASKLAQITSALKGEAPAS